MIPNKQALHSACLLNQYRVPELKTSLCSTEYMIAVKDQRCYTPLASDLIVRLCANPPPIMVLHTMLISCIESGFVNMDDTIFPKFTELLRFLDKGKADKNWYLDIISTLTRGQHEIFKPNYIYFKEAKTKDFTIQNADGFFDRLPQHQNRKGNGSVLLTQEQKELRTINRLDQQKQHLNQRIQKQQAKMAKVKAHEDKYIKMFNEKKAERQVMLDQLAEQNRIQAREQAQALALERANQDARDKENHNSNNKGRKTYNQPMSEKTMKIVADARMKEDVRMNEGPNDISTIQR